VRGAEDLPFALSSYAFDLGEDFIELFLRFVGACTCFSELDGW